MNRPKLIKLVLFACIMINAMSLLAAPKTDIVIMKNGDRVTGEVKGLLRGKLELNTDHMGTIQIDWEDIQEIISRTSQAIELANGTRFFGPLQKPEDAEMVVVNTEQGAVGVDAEDIISMYPVESGFWDRLDLSAQLGFNWDKSSEVGKYQLGVDAAWRDPRFITRGSFTTELTTQNEQSSTTRSVLDFSHMRFLENKRFRSVFGNLENNDELGLDLRALLGIGYGWIPVRSQHSLLGLVAGVDVNHEIPNEGSAETNYELVGTLLYEYYLYSHPKRQFSVDFSIFPSITQRGRYRASLNTSFKIELIKDLYWDLSAYGSYDNQPLSEQGSSSDYGVNSSIGYNF